MIGWGSCRVPQDLVQVPAKGSLLNRDLAHVINHAIDRQQVAVRPSSKHLEQATFPVRVQDLMDADLSLYQLQVEALLDAISHVENRLASHAVCDARVIRWCDELHVAEARLLQDEDVQLRALFYVVIEKPKHIVEPVLFCLGDTRYQGSHITGDAVLSVAQRPALDNVGRALERNRVSLRLNRVEKRDQFGELTSADTQCLIRAEVGDACLKLVRLVIPVDPASVKLHELFHAIYELRGVKARHIQVRSRIHQVSHVIVNAEPLQLSCLTAFYNREGLVNGDTVVERSGRRLNTDRPVGQYLRRVPAVLLVPIDAEHVICEVLAILELSFAGFHLLDIDGVNLQVRCFESRSCEPCLSGEASE